MKLDEVPENEFNCLGSRNEMNQTRIVGALIFFICVALMLESAIFFNELNRQIAIGYSIRNFIVRCLDLSLVDGKRPVNYMVIGLSLLYYVL